MRIFLCTLSMVRNLTIQKSEEIEEIKVPGYVVNRYNASVCVSPLLSTILALSVFSRSLFSILRLVLLRSNLPRFTLPKSIKVPFYHPRGRKVGLS